MKKLPALSRATPAGTPKWGNWAAKRRPADLYARRPHWSPNIVIILIVMAALVIGVLGGLLVGVGQKMLVAPIIGAAGGIILLMLPLEWMLGLLLAASFIVVGVLTFFANIGMITWLPYSLAGFLYFYFLFRVIETRHSGETRLSLMFLWLGVFLLLAIVTSLYMGIAPMQWVAVGKNYFAFWSVLLIMAFLPLKEKSIEQLWKIFILVALVQLPVALYQYLVVGGSRVEAGTGDAWDVVVGTFGGSEEGGGQSAALGFFEVVMVVFALALWRRKLISKKLLALVLVVAAATIYLAEVKAMLVLMPLAFLMIYRRDLLRRPRELIIGLTLIVGFMSIMPIAYNTLHYERQGRRAMTATEFVDSVIYQADPYLINRVSGQMGRIKQLDFWAEQNATGRPYEILFGYGIGSTKLSRLYIGDVARRYYPLPLGNTSASIMLWEVGVMGLLFFVAVLLAGSRLAARLATDMQIPAFHRAILETSAVGLVLVVMTLPYKHYAIQVSSIQLLIVLMLGQAAYWYARVGTAKAGQP